LLWQLEEDLIQVRSSWRASELLVASVLLGLLVFIIAMLINLGLYISLALSLTCLFLPWLYVRYLRDKYYRTFEEQLADTLLLMGNSLKAGFSFLQTMEMVGRESQPPICDEFARVVQEISVGVPVAQALQNLTVRVRSMDLNLMVTAVIIQREVGGGLAEILETIAEIIRERMRIKREIRVLTTQGKWSGGILAMLPVGIAFAIHLSNKMADPYSESFVQPLLNDPLGLTMLAAAIGLEVVGFLVIMRIVSIRV
jgi:tight adherence protein B